MNQQNEIEQWIESADKNSMPERLERLKQLRDHYDRDHGILFYGGYIPARAFEEMQFCYIHGSYISCVLAAQVVLEHMLAALLEETDCDPAGFGFAKLCDAALNEDLISQPEFDRFNVLRRLRNPYTHSQPLMGRSCIIRRVAESMVSPQDIFKADAESALETVIEFISRPPFAVG